MRRRVLKAACAAMRGIGILCGCIRGGIEEFGARLDAKLGRLYPTVLVIRTVSIVEVGKPN